MACLDHACTNEECEWWGCSNELVSNCPVCGSRVISFFDEHPWGNKCSDDDEEEDEWEDEWEEYYLDE